MNWLQKKLFVMAEVANPIQVEVDGIRFTSASRYYDGDAQKIAHLLKDNNPKAIEMVAARLSNMISPFAVIVPIPNRCGYARETLELAKVLSKYSGVPIADVLKGNERSSLYDMKKQGKTLSEQELGFRQTEALPFYRTPILLDNVTATGTTAKAAYHALGNRGEILTYAIDDPILENARPIEQIHTSMRR